MKAFQVREEFGIDSLKIVEVPDVQPAYGEVLLKMRAFSLNYRDLLVVKGLYNPKITLPFVPLSDGVGEVVAVGPGVTRLEVGDRVAGNFVQQWISGELTTDMSRSSLGGGGQGVLAEFISLDAEGVVKIPEHLSDEEAATLPCAALTAWHALVTEGKLKAGDTVLVQGTGGVSLFATQFAALMGARVIATSSSNQKLNRIRDLGAIHGINYKEQPDWDKRVRELTDRAGVDHVVEVGGAGTMERSLKSVRVGGRISLIGILAGGSAFNPMPILMKKVCVQGIYVGSREMFEQMNQAIEVNQLRPVVDRVYPFNEVPQALEHMEQGRHFGKICIKR